MTVQAKPAAIRPTSSSSIATFTAKPFIAKAIVEEKQDHEIDPLDLPPPPPDMLAELEGSDKPDKESIRKPDPVRDFFDFLDEQEGKKLPGKLKSPFLQRGNTGSPSPNSSPNLNQFRSSGAPLDHQIAVAAAAAAQRNSSSNSPKMLNRNSVNSLPAQQQQQKLSPRPLLTTDFDALPEITSNNNNKTTITSSHQQPLINDNNNRQHPHYEQEVIQGEDQVWICRKCVAPIEAGQVAIFAERAGSDKCWHPQCFTCSICQVFTPLDDSCL